MQLVKAKRGRQVWQAWTTEDGARPDGRWAIERFEDAGSTWSLIFNPFDRGGYHLVQGLTFGTVDHAAEAIEDGSAVAALTAELAEIAADATRTDRERARAAQAQTVLAVA